MNQEEIEIKKVQPSKMSDYVKQYNQTRYQRDKEKLLLISAQKTRCALCECEVTKFTRHLQSNKHKYNIATLKRKL